MFGMPLGMPIRLKSGRLGIYIMLERHTMHRSSEQDRFRLFRILAAKRK